MQSPLNSTVKQVPQPQMIGEPVAKKDIVLVTGSSGLIGTALIQQLAEQYKVIGLDIKEFKSALPAEYISMDITSKDSIHQALQQVRKQYGTQIASVIHLAAYYDFEGKPSPLYEKITVEGTKLLLEALQDFNVQQFIFSSSMLVYRPTKPGIKLTELSPIVPSWDYPKSKVVTEKLIHEKRGNIPVVILRIAGVYNDEGNSIPITNQIQRIYERTITSHLYSGDTSSGNTFVHLDDLVNAFLKTVEKRGHLQQDIIINIGEAEPVSYEELQQTIGQLIHGVEAWRTFEIPKPLAKLGATVQDVFGDPFIKPWMIDRADDHYEIDITRAKKILGWQPNHKLLTTLPRMIEGLKANPLAWYKKNNLDPPASLERGEAQPAGG